MSKSGIILGVLAVCIGLAIWVGSSFTKQITQTPETFIVGEEFMLHLAAGEYDEASALAKADLQTPESQAMLIDIAEDNAAVLTANTEVHLTGRGIQNNIRYAYGTINSGEIESPLYMEFVDENGETRVTYFSFNQADIDDMTDYDTTE